MCPVLRASVAGYRHHVFVESLRWDLPCIAGFEQDEFDRAGATHLVACDDRHRVVGYARLLPTTAPYLLATHFPHLLGGQPAPCSPAVWELSRFTSAPGPHAEGGERSPGAQTRIGKQLLLEAVSYVQGRGCHDLVFCTNVAIERLAHRWGVEIRRLGAPQRSPAGLLVAAMIRCSARTIAALASDAFERAPRAVAEKAVARAELAVAD
ncbi:MAG: acyl-homoserine-lactone synthase [Pseudomonadota bacterium]